MECNLFCRSPPASPQSTRYHSRPGRPGSRKKKKVSDGGGRSEGRVGGGSWIGIWVRTRRHARTLGPHLMELTPTGNVRVPVLLLVVLVGTLLRGALHGICQMIPRNTRYPYLPHGVQLSSLAPSCQGKEPWANIGRLGLIRHAAVVCPLRGGTLAPARLDSTLRLCPCNTFHLLAHQSVSKPSRAWTGSLGFAISWGLEMECSAAALFQVPTTGFCPGPDDSPLAIGTSICPNGIVTPIDRSVVLK